MANLQALLGGAGVGFLVGGPPGALVGAGAAWLSGLGDDASAAAAAAAVTPAAAAASSTVAAPGSALGTDTDTGIINYVPIATGSVNLTPGSMPMIPAPITPTHIIVGDGGGGSGGISTLDPNNPDMGGGFAPSTSAGASPGMSLPLIAPSVPTGPDVGSLTSTPLGVDPNDPSVGGGFAPPHYAPIVISPVVIALPPATPPALGPFVDPNDPAHGGGFVGPNIFDTPGVIIGQDNSGWQSPAPPSTSEIPIMLPIVSAPAASTGAPAKPPGGPVVIIQPPTTGGRQMLSGWGGWR